MKDKVKITKSKEGLRVSFKATEECYNDLKQLHNNYEKFIEEQIKKWEETE